MGNVIDSGAEAVIYLDGNVVKDRISKGYRLKEIDERLRKSRTRREAKILQKLASIDFPAPRLIECNNKEKIVMDFIKGPRLRDILERKDYLKLSEEIGKKIAILHNHCIIHGDLTTSNMILRNNEIHFIDFGLSFFSAKVEDKAVDLHLLKQALESKHYRTWQECFDSALKAYTREAMEGDAVLKRLEKVEARGRNKTKS
jgi:TP53 regulating kinase-like protein